MHEFWLPVWYIVVACFGIATISVLCTVMEIKTEVELICIAMCLRLSFPVLVLEDQHSSQHRTKKPRKGFFQWIATTEGDDSRVLQIHNPDATQQA